MYQIYYVVDGVPFMLKCDTYADALKHCALLELDKLTDKYELTQTLKTYESNNYKKGDSRCSDKRTEHTCLQKSKYGNLQGQENMQLSIF